MPKRIQRKREKGWRKPEGAKYVGRGSEYGNPYPVQLFLETAKETFTPSCDYSALNPQGVRKQINADVLTYARSLAVQAYCGYLQLYPEIGEAAKRELRGKDLMCWCAPGQPCHADVLLELVNQ